MKETHTQTSTEKQAVKALRIASLEIAEWFENSTCQSDDLEFASKILSDLADNIPTPESLRVLSELLTMIADDAKRLKTDDEHEAHATESLCELVGENLMARYLKAVGRA